jgi:hypothetical protein
LSEHVDARTRGEAKLRPGAMTMAMRAAPRAEGPRHLRWAIAHDGVIVREAVAPPDRAITVGGDGDVPCGALGRAQPLARFSGGRWMLRVHRAWEARVGSKRIETRDAAEWTEIDLEDRAKLSIEGRTILLSLVDRPIARPAPQLPTSLRGGVLSVADWRFTAFVTASCIAHFAFVIFLLERDWPVEQAFLPDDRMVEAIFVEPPEPVDPPEQPLDRTVADADEPSQDREHSEPGPTRETPDRPRAPRSNEPQRSADDEARLAMEGVQLLLGAELGAEDSAIQNLLRDGAPTANQASIMEDIEGTTIAANDETRLREREGNRDCVNCGPRFGLETLGRDNTRPVDEGEPIREVVITVRPEPIEPIDPPPPGFDLRELHRMLRGRMTAVQHCYERELTQGLVSGGGRITISLTVVPIGTLERVHALDNTTGSDSLAACSIRSIQSVRVRSGPSEPIEVHYPIVFNRQE